jgi:hypothetical protein
MVIKYTNIYHSKALQNLPKFGIFGLKTNHLATLAGSESLPKRGAAVRPATLHMSAFGQTFNLPLKPSQNLLSPYAEIVDTFADPATGKISQRKISIVADANEYPRLVSTKLDFIFFDIFSGYLLKIFYVKDSFCISSLVT